MRLTCQDSDDNHGRTAIRAGEYRLDRFVRRCFVVIYTVGGCHEQQSPRYFQVILTPRIGQQAIMADAVEAARQHMQKETSHELISAECHGLVAGTAFGPVVFIPERDAVLIGVDKALV